MITTPVGWVGALTIGLIAATASGAASHYGGEALASTLKGSYFYDASGRRRNTWLDESVEDLEDGVRIALQGAENVGDGIMAGIHEIPDLSHRYYRNARDGIAETWDDFEDGFGRLWDRTFD